MASFLAMPVIAHAQSKYKDIAAGLQHAMVLKTDGTLWTFGLNSDGQLGDGTRTNRDKPVKILDNVSKITAGERCSYALRNDGTL